MEIFGKNENFSQTLKFLPKIEILDKNRIFRKKGYNA